MGRMSATKTNPGNYFEDFSVGQVIEHATPRTVTEGDRALYGAIYPTRFAVPSSAEFAASVGLAPHPVEELIGFHIAFGKTVPDVSLNAVANLGYAECRFHVPVVPGDTLRTRSEVIGLKENSNGRTGVVWVRSTATNQRGEVAIDWARWVMVHKRSPESPAPETVVPDAGTRRGARGPGGARRPRLQRVRRRCRRRAAPVRRLRGGGADRPRRRRDPQRSRAHDGHPAVAEHRQGALQHRGAPRRHPARLRRPRDLPGARAVLQRPGQRPARRRDQRRGPRRPAFAGDTVYAWSEVLDKAEVDARAWVRSGCGWWPRRAATSR